MLDLAGNQGMNTVGKTKPQECAIGICGLGDRAGYVASTLLAHDTRFRCRAYADPSPRGLRHLREFGVGKVAAYDNIEAMLGNEDLDLLLVGSPNHLHFRHIRAGLEAGCKVFTEKPVVIDEAQTFALLDLLQQHGADRVMTGLVLRYSPLYRDLRRAVESGALGDIVSIEASEHLGPNHGAFFMKDWRRYESLTGGYLLEKCVHDLDIYQSIVKSRPARVASFGGRRTFVPENLNLEEARVYREWPGGWQATDKVFDSDASIVDYQTVLVEYANGANLCFHSNLHVPDKSRRFCVIGAKGMAEGDFERNYFKVHDAQTGKRVKEASYQFDRRKGHYGAEEAMAADLSAYFFEDEPLSVSVVDGLKAGLLAMKIDEARKSGRVLSLQDTWVRFDAAAP